MQFSTNIGFRSIQSSGRLLVYSIKFGIVIPIFRKKKVIDRQAYLYLTDAMMISFPAPAEPPISETIKLGTIAKQRVKKFRIHGSSRKSRNPYQNKNMSQVKIISVMIL